jgi:hypothetical protein
MLKEQDRFNWKQRCLVNTLRDEAEEASAWMKGRKVTPKLVALWLRRPPFRRAVGRATKEHNRHLLRVDLVRLRAEAWATIGRMLRGEITLDALTLELCRAIIALCDIEFRRAERSGARRQKKGPRFEEPADLTHPNAAAEDDAIVARMRARSVAALLKRVQKAGTARTEASSSARTEASSSARTEASSSAKPQAEGSSSESLSLPSSSSSSASEKEVSQPG